MLTGKMCLHDARSGLHSAGVHHSKPLPFALAYQEGHDDPQLLTWYPRVRVRYRSRIHIPQMRVQPCTPHHQRKLACVPVLQQHQLSLPTCLCRTHRKRHAQNDASVHIFSPSENRISSADRSSHFLCTAAPIAHASAYLWCHASGSKVGNSVLKAAKNDAALQAESWCQPLCFGGGQRAGKGSPRQVC